MLTLGIDIGTSSIKVTIMEIESQKQIVSVSYPETEAEIKSLHKGWAEQSPEEWWENTRICIQKAHASKKYNPRDIIAIGIAYQMHGLVLVDKQGEVLRDAIIWCDSRAVDIGEKAFEKLGSTYCLESLLNSPGNFTAAKLAWVKEFEPELYGQIKYVMLPGDFIAYKLTGEVTTTISALSEGVFWNFKDNTISEELLDYFGFTKNIFAPIQELFSNHGQIKAGIAKEFGLAENVVVSYKAGDQPNNALSLNVLSPGEVAATAGTSGVIYAVSDRLVHDRLSRVNTFAHVNYRPDNIRTGMLLCINGTGILNSWLKRNIGEGRDYPELNELAAQTSIGSKGLSVLPFGNGVERMLCNKPLDAVWYGLDYNRHGKSEMLRAAQEGIAFAFRYGFDIMREGGVETKVIRAAKANMFRSPIFSSAFASLTQTTVELREGDGSLGAAIGAAMGLGVFHTSTDSHANSIEKIYPENIELYEELYQDWKYNLEKHLQS